MRGFAFEVEGLVVPPEGSGHQKGVPARQLGGVPMELAGDRLGQILVGDGRAIGLAPERVRGQRWAGWGTEDEVWLRDRCGQGTPCNQNP